MEETEVECPSCKKPSDDSFMICCDSCDSWYHGQCVGQFKNKQKQMWIGPCCCNRWMGEWIKAKQSKRTAAPSVKDPPSECSPSRKMNPGKKLKLSALSPNFTRIRKSENSDSLNLDKPCCLPDLNRTPIKYSIDISSCNIPIKSPAGVVSIKDADAAKSTSPFKVSLLQSADKGVTTAPTFNSDPPPLHVIQLNCSSNESPMLKDHSTRDRNKRMLSVDKVHSQPKSTKKRSLSLSLQSKIVQNDHNSEKSSHNFATRLSNASASLSARKGKSEDSDSINLDEPGGLPDLNRKPTKYSIESSASACNIPIKSPAGLVSMKDAGVARSTSPFKVSFLQTIDKGVATAPKLHSDPPTSNVLQLSCTSNESAMLKDHSTRDRIKRMLFADNVHFQPAKPTNKRSTLNKSLQISKTAKRKSEDSDSFNWDDEPSGLPDLNRKPTKYGIESSASACNIPIKSPAGLVSMKDAGVAKSTSPFKVSFLQTIDKGVATAPKLHSDPPTSNVLQLSCTSNEYAMLEDHSTRDCIKRMPFAGKVHSQTAKPTNKTSSLNESLQTSKTAKSDQNSRKPRQKFSSSLLNVSELSAGKGTPPVVTNQSKVNPGKKQDVFTLSPDFEKSRKSQDSDSSDLDENIFQPKKKKSVKQNFTPDLSVKKVPKLRSRHH
ncbi:Transcription initiation factor TFIID subunit 3 [Frankliniella fusca]|uniref:Transcription initiation factor TFIID subunit 3 n=1 Tax=Frankliniella fusca TaxID=407009 RepID=A0AAE1HFN6_9NEOP|nr:Transcription initiation factor TFIID subunit 3 [Frankliniella fusca]